MNNKNNNFLAVAVALFVFSGCASSPPEPVIDKLDYNTGVTVTYSRTPFTFSPNEKADDYSAVEFVQIGAIEVNSMGSLKYYLWLGISEPKYLEGSGSHPHGFESLEFDFDGRKVNVDVLGWTHEAIGTSEPVYDGLFRSTQDAYYEVTLEQIEMLERSRDVSFTTASADSSVYTPWYKSVSPQEDLAEFTRVVRE